MKPSTREVKLDDLIACSACDWLHYRAPLAPGETSCCERCGDVMQTRKLFTVDRSLAAALAGTVLLIISLCMPFLSLSRAGIESHISVLDTVRSLWSGNMLGIGIVTLAFIIVLPLARFVLLIYVLWRIRFKRPVRRAMRTAFRWSILIEPWAMAEIFMMGVVVSLVKISTLANLQLGLAFWTLLALIGVLVYINMVLCRDTVWAHLHQTA